MPIIPKIAPTNITDIRSLRALADGRAMTLARIAEVDTATAGSAALRRLASANLVSRSTLDVDGRSETVWRITEAGLKRLNRGKESGRELPPNRNGVLKIGALVPIFGGNRLLGPKVGELLDGCAWVGVPFCGGLSEFQWIKARSITANDLHSHIINLAMVSADQLLGPQLWRRLRRLPLHVGVLKKLQDHCRTMEEKRWDGKPDLDWAMGYFYSSWAARNGAAGTRNEFSAPLSVRWKSGGGDSAVRLFNSAAGLKLWRKILERVTFVCMDAFEFLAKCKDSGADASCGRSGIYCDPPFSGPGAAYKFGFSDAEHAKLAQVLAGYRKARVVLRCYDIPLMRRLYLKESWRWVELIGKKQSNANSPEVLLTRN